MATDDYFLTPQSADAEFERLQTQAGFLAEPIKAKLEVLGLSAGMRCLEIGPGSGELVRWLIGRGATIDVIDISDKWFSTYAHDNVVVRVGDVRTAELDGGYDFVIVSYVLHHLPERHQVVSKLARALASGGWLIACEPSFSLGWTAAGTPDFVEAWKAVTQQFQRLGVDYEWGLQLPSAMRDAGLTAVDGMVSSALVMDNSLGARIIEYAIPIARQLAVTQEWPVIGLFAALDAGLKDPKLVAGPAPNVVCWGRRS
jgi:SAM-dependent methyltransferase